MRAALSRSGRFEESLIYLQKETEIRRTVLGKNDPRVMNCDKEYRLLKGIIVGMNLLRKKNYQGMFKVLELVVLNNNSFTPDSICFLLYSAVLSKQSNARMKKHLEQITKKWIMNNLFPRIDRTKIAVALAHYFLIQKCFNEALKYAQWVEKTEPGMLFTYREIEIAGMEESSIEEGTQILFNALGNAYIQKIREAQISQQQPPMATSSLTIPPKKQQRAGKSSRRKH